MENASKALIIAGSVLIALLVISLLVVFYNNIKNLMEAEHTQDITEQIAEYNKKYDVYYRNNLYGSEILSICNKVYDYNKREVEEEGYSKLDIQVTFNKQIIAYNSEIIIDTKQTYNSDTLKQKVEYLESNIENYGKQKVSGKTIEVLSGLRTNEIKDLLGTENISEVQAKINLYLGYKSALSNLKAKTFSATKFEYDQNTGRVEKMIFKEN